MNVLFFLRLPCQVSKTVYSTDLNKLYTLLQSFLIQDWNENANQIQTAELYKFITHRVRCRLQSVGKLLSILKFPGVLSIISNRVRIHLHSTFTFYQHAGKTILSVGSPYRFAYGRNCLIIVRLTKGLKVVRGKNISLIAVLFYRA